MPTTRKKTSGYVECACRDCMDLAISSDDIKRVLCLPCKAAGCDESGTADCARDDAYEEADPVAEPTIGGTVQARVMLRVKLTGYRARPSFIAPGTIGWLEPQELSVDGDVIHGRFYPMEPDGSRKGFGLVVWPLFETINALEPKPGTTSGG